MTATLLILAAGIGSRYGGLKQADGIGPSGEAILDYSIYDAIKAGFGRVVFVIRREIEADMQKIFFEKWEDKIDIDFVFQDMDALPGGYDPPEGRTKPWGTGHAIWVAKDHIEQPFAVINADDFYGRESFQKTATFLSDMENLIQGRYCLIGYILKNTLSDHGYVSRGECEVEEGNLLSRITERLKIQREGEKVIYRGDDGEIIAIPEDAIVSMNMWGFMPSIFRHLEDDLKEFLEENSGSEKKEFLLPDVIDRLIHEGDVQVPVLPTTSKWFGITYQEDRPIVEAKLRRLVEDGEYPSPIWEGKG
jgi:dTDP-glucose pyrophosphorylase